MKKSPVPFAIRYHKWLDLGHKMTVYTLCGISVLGTGYVGYSWLQFRLRHKPAAEQKRLETLSADGEKL